MSDSPEQAEILGVLAEARRLVDEQRRAFRCADFASFLATAMAIDRLTERLRHLERSQTEQLAASTRAEVLELQSRLDEQCSLLATAIGASRPPNRTYARLPAPKTQSSLLLDRYS